jgi:hypothetical protein
MIDKLKRYALVHEWNRGIMAEDVNGTYTHWYTAQQELGALQAENAELQIKVAGWKCSWQESTDREIELNKEIERLQNLLAYNVELKG